jgi:hypothetical protein
MGENLEETWAEAEEVRRRMAESPNQFHAADPDLIFDYLAMGSRVEDVLMIFRKEVR